MFTCKGGNVITRSNTDIRYCVGKLDYSIKGVRHGPIIAQTSDCTLCRCKESSAERIDFRTM